jgi:maleate isomerase
MIGAGTTYRVGLIVPSSNLTMETELPELLARREAAVPGERFTFHSSRMRLTHVTPEGLRAMNAQTGRAAAELADAACDVVATACLVAIMAQGGRYHLDAEQEISSVLDAAGVPAPVVSSAGALLNALKTLGARRIGVVTPYMPALTDLVCGYIEDLEIDVVDRVSLSVPDNLAVARLDPLDLHEHHKRLDLTGCDALVLSACVQMPSLPAIAAVEREVGIPVLSAATATCFCVLRALGLPTGIPDAGRLLSGAVDEAFVPAVPPRNVAGAAEPG